MHHYLTCLLVPVPSQLITVLFLASSIEHISTDVGMVVSFAIHLGIYLVSQLWGLDAAFNAFLFYFCFFHTPKHYMRELQKGNRNAVILGALSGFALSVSGAVPLEFTLTNQMQRIILAHISTVYYS